MTTNARKNKNAAAASGIRMPEVGSGSRVEKLGLAHLFVQGSKSMAVAERILDGEPHTRKELSASETLAPSSVTRVVDTLQEAGVVINRGTASGSRDALYHAEVTQGDEAPSNSWSFRAPQDAGPLVRLEGMEYAGDGQILVTLASELGTVTGTAVMTPAFTELTREGLPLTRVTLMAGGAQDWLLGTPATGVAVTGVSWVASA